VPPYELGLGKLIFLLPVDMKLYNLAKLPTNKLYKQIGKVYLFCFQIAFLCWAQASGFKVINLRVCA
jgi:hypothetical protein